MFDWTENLLRSSRGSMESKEEGLDLKVFACHTCTISHTYTLVPQTECVSERRGEKQ